jgi:hypothetical protein
MNLRPFALCLLAVACSRATPAGSPAPIALPALDPPAVQVLLGALAHDSMEGRRTGTPGTARAARLVAAEFARAGLVAAGDSGYYQRVPLRLTTDTAGRRRLVVLRDWAAFDSVPPAERVLEANVVGLVRGSDAALRDEAVLVTAHYDHLGVGRPVNGDSIYNGADDDASGTIALIGIARALARGPAPRRTVVFLACTGEEVGLLGTRWYIAHPVVPLERTVANLNVEMIGRPDTLVGAAKVWLTGFERSTMGETFAAAGLAIVPDARPEMRFFERSDNIAFARRGIPAHTLSTYGLHRDYHQPSDEADRADPVHMAAVIDAAAQATRLLADGPAPQWKPGGRPEARP